MSETITRLSHENRRKRAANIRQRVANGESVESVAADVGVCVGTVILYSRGLKPVHGKMMNRQRRIRGLISSGMSVEEVAESEQVSYTTVVNSSVGLPRPKHYPTNCAYRAIAKLITGDDSFVDIGRSVLLSRERVRQIYEKCRESGVPVRVRKGRKN